MEGELKGLIRARLLGLEVELENEDLIMLIRYLTIHVLVLT